MHPPVQSTSFDHALAPPVKEVPRDATAQKTHSHHLSVACKHDSLRLIAKINNMDEALIHSHYVCVDSS